MPVPLACPVFLTTADQAQLASLVRAHCTPHALVFRCRLILRTAAPEQPANLPVATAMHCERHSVGRWRHRSRTPGLKGLQEAPRAGRPRRFSPAAPVAVLSIAARKPATDSCSAPRWRRAGLGAALPQHHGPQTMRRSSRWRILAEADLKPPRSVYGRNRHEADGATKAHDRCPLYVHALHFSHQGRCVMCADEKTAMPMLPRADPTQPVPPGKPEQRAHAYLRPGVRALLASCVVPPGHRVWHLGQTRTSRDGAAHLAHVVQPRPAMPRDAGVVDHRKTH